MKPRMLTVEIPAALAEQINAAWDDSMRATPVDGFWTIRIHRHAHLAGLYRQLSTQVRGTAAKLVSHAAIDAENYHLYRVHFCSKSEQDEQNERGGQGG